MKVMKFGGSSLATCEMMNQVVSIIKDQDASEIWVVASALGGVTDEILKIAHLAERKESSYKQHMDQLVVRHMNFIGELDEHNDALKGTVSSFLEELGHICDGIYELNELSPKVLDRVMSFGELCSSNILTHALKKQGVDAAFVDSRDLIVTDENFNFAHVDFDKTNQKIVEASLPNCTVKVLPGFVAKSTNGRVTTLGRNGSDYSAAIFGAAKEAEVVEIWTDVNGVMTANPKFVKTAQTIEKMSYEEAMELSHFGASVLHSPTLKPVMDKNISLHVRNTYAPKELGTVVSSESSKAVVAGISTVPNVSFVRIEGSGMVGVVGVAGRLFAALANEKVNLIMISQGSSEHSICFAVAQGEEEAAKLAIVKEFDYEIKMKLIDAPIAQTDMCTLAVVGEHMRKNPGIAGKVFSALGDEKVNVVAIAQGSSELNISMIISKSDESAALNAVHAAFF